MFKHITSSYTGQDATLEILVMLSVAFMLGFIFRWTYGQVTKTRMQTEIERLKGLEAELRRSKLRIARKLDYVEAQLRRKDKGQEELDDGATLKILKSSI